MPHSPKEKNWAQKQRSAFLVDEYKFGFTPNKGLLTRFADPIPIGDKKNRIALEVEKTTRWGNLT